VYWQVGRLASFAVAQRTGSNMLVGTPDGGTFTFDELRAELATAGFTKARVRLREAAMNCIVVAKRRPRPYPFTNNSRRRPQDIARRGHYWKGRPRNYRGLH
jgi:hypothetical protein